MMLMRVMFENKNQYQLLKLSKIILFCSVLSMRVFNSRLTFVFKVNIFT